MYVSWADFSKRTLGNTDPEKGQVDISEQQYMRLSTMADLIIDDWTLDRVGKAVKNGEELPDSVKTLYVAIVENLPALLSNSKAQTGGLVSSFSNGIDSYSFDVTSTVNDELKRSLGWQLELLPVEWISACVSFEGGNKYAG